MASSLPTGNKVFSFLFDSHLHLQCTATGFGDMHLVPDMKSLTVASWMDKTALVLCDLYDNKTHERINVGPRSMLRFVFDLVMTFCLSWRLLYWFAFS